MCRDGADHELRRLVVLTTFYPHPAETARALFIRWLVGQYKQRVSDVMVISPLILNLGRRIDKLRKLRSIVPRFTKEEGVNIWRPSQIVLPGLGFLSSFTFFFACFFRLYKIRSSKKAFLVQAHCGFPDAVGAFYACWLLSIPLAITLHGSDVNILAKKKIIRIQMAKALSYAYHIVVVSEAMRKNVIDLFPSLDKNKIVKIPCAGFNPVTFNLPPLGANKEECLKRIAFVGNLFPVKGIENLIYALKILVGMFSDVELDIVGEGFLEKPLKLLVDKNGLQQRVKFLGVLEPEAVAALLKSVNVLCLPSYSEGMPNVIVEAFACGIPVVATNVGGIPELVNADMGILVEPGSVESLVNGLKMALTREWDRSSIRKNISHYTWDELAKRNLEMLKSAEVVSGYV